MSPREGFRESRRCSRDTYPQSYIIEHALVYEDASFGGAHADLRFRAQGQEFLVCGVDFGVYDSG